ncbi:MAG TPA: class I adenylate-forming enzyme family protein [Chthoniobacterales bacterium]
MKMQAANIIDLIRKQAELQPDHVAFACVDSNERITYGDLLQRVNAVADWLQARGCRRFDRCGLHCLEGPEFLVNALGILAAGLAVAPISITVPPKELDRVIGAAGLHWLLGADKKLVRFPFAGFVDTKEDRDYRATNPAYIRFTSGSTGPRKGVLLGHNAILDRLATADAILRISPCDRVWFRLPMADHFVVSILLYLSRGATVLTTRSQEPEVLSELVSGFRPTIIYGSPESYSVLIEKLSGDLATVRLAICTTTLLAPKTRNAFQSRFGRPLNPALGIIEVGLVTLNQTEDKPDSIGTVMPGYQVTLLDEKGVKVPSGKAGELYVNGLGLLDAYLAPWRPRTQILGADGYATGDFATIDESGYLRLVGRSKNRLEVSGLHFFCEELEQIVNSYPGVQESIVFIDPTTRTLSAEIVSQSESFQGLADFLRQRLDPRQVPISFRRVAELPRTPNGKLLRH